MNLRVLMLLVFIGLIAGCGPTGYATRDSGYARSGYGGYRSVSCYDCGRVTHIERVYGRGETSGGGAVLGAVVGGVLGNQIGSGSGRRAATAAGAIAGGLAGNEMERRRRSEAHYEVHVRTDDDRRMVVVQRRLDGIRVGDRVRVVGDRAELLAYR